MIKPITLLEELKICAISQGFGADMRPWIKHPVINAILYARLLEILGVKLYLKGVPK